MFKRGPSFDCSAYQTNIHSTVVDYCIALCLLNECQYLRSRQECDNQLCSFILFFNAKKVRPIAVYRRIKITVYIYSNEMISHWLTSYISVRTSAVYRWEVHSWIFSLLSLLWIPSVTTKGPKQGCLSVYLLELK